MIVGIAINGVPIHSGTSELHYDAFYPKDYSTYTTHGSIKSDQCLGNNDHSSYYHYYTFSPCLLPSTAKSSLTGEICDNVPACKSDPKTYSVGSITNGNKKLIPVGIAKDGHMIYGPYNENGELWQPCDVDRCNGITIEENYVYVVTMFHPYTIGCWGPTKKS